MVKRLLLGTWFKIYYVLAFVIGISIGVAVFIYLPLSQYGNYGIASPIQQPQIEESPAERAKPTIEYTSTYIQEKKAIRPVVSTPSKAVANISSIEKPLRNEKAAVIDKEERTDLTPLKREDILADTAGVKGGLARISNLAIINISILELDGGDLAIKLYIKALEDISVSISGIDLVGKPFPFGWDGKKWVLGDLENQCLRRIPVKPLIEYYTTIGNLTLNADDEAIIDIYVKINGNVFGKYELRIALTVDNLQSTISSEILMGGYSDPSEPPPKNIREVLYRCLEASR